MEVLQGSIHISLKCCKGQLYFTELGMHVSGGFLHMHVSCGFLHMNVSGGFLDMHVGGSFLDMHGNSGLLGIHVSGVFLYMHVSGGFLNMCVDVNPCGVVIRQSVPLMDTNRCAYNGIWFYASDYVM